MDFQNRPGGKTGGGGVASWSESNRDRRERLRQLALETIDLNKDPYFMKNHLGSYECKLCLTLHNNEGSYLAHTQGKKHQANLARRAAKEAKEAPQQLAPEKPRIEPKKFVKIGRPGYRVTKQKDPETGQQSLLFQVDYPEIAEGVIPRHRFMSAYEQKIEPPDRRWQYLLFAAEPYETIAFKVPSREVEKHDSKFWTHWNKDTKQFFLQFAFKMDQLRMPPPHPKMWEGHSMRLPPPPGAPMLGVPPPPPLLPVPPPPPSMFFSNKQLIHLANSLPFFFRRGGRTSYEVPAPWGRAGYVGLDDLQGVGSRPRAQGILGLYRTKRLPCTLTPDVRSPSGVKTRQSRGFPRSTLQPDTWRHNITQISFSSFRKTISEERDSSNIFSMFSKAKRFEPLVAQKNQKKTNVHKKLDSESTKINTKTSSSLCKSRSNTLNSIRPVDGQSQCSSVQSSKSLKFATPKAFKITKAPNSSIKKTLTCPKNKILPQDELVQAQDVEIRNKDQTICEYNKQIEDYKNEIAQLQEILKELATKFRQSHNNIDFNEIDRKLSKLRINNTNCHTEHNAVQGTDAEKVSAMINDMRSRIIELEKKCEALDNEVYDKQMELSSLEEVITVRDSLCKDLQEKLTSNELTLAETQQRLEMVKGHHALALEANESIRREYKIELEALKTKLDEEKQAIISKCKVDQENLKTKHNASIESLKNQMLKEKCEALEQLHSQLIIKEQEMKAKLEQIEESASEKLKICEIQFEERSQSIQEHCSQQEKTIQYLEQEIKELKYTLDLTNNQNSDLKQELNNLKNCKDELSTEKFNFIEEIKTLKDELIEKTINYENEKNKLNLAVEKAIKEKNKFETSLSVTRDIVHVLTLRLRESDSELEQLEDQVQMLTSAKEVLENELTTYKNTLNNTVRECDEYKEALVNILKSKAALTKEHTRIMEHNVTLIESLQNVEKEAYRELGTIKNELIEDVELLKKESNSQIKFLREEVEKKRVLCEMATEHAGQATAAAEQSRVLLAQAAADLSRLENENERYQQQIQDQQSLVVELSLLRQENEELTMTVAKQSSIIDKLKKDLEQSQYTPKSPSVLRKSLKVGKENMQTISPLRERNL